jgi:light-regulated signal transduction histidine kinase (bacteriophytochrome)
MVPSNSARRPEHGPIGRESSVVTAQLDLTAHERDGHLILELEPSAAPRETAAQILAKLRAIGTELDATHDLTQLCQAAARAIRRLTGFDRVMIYRFLDDGAGCVIAEDKLPELAPFLNHHYPASDIPKSLYAN